jgi:hypothetical protein
VLDGNAFGHSNCTLNPVRELYIVSTPVLTTSFTCAPATATVMATTVSLDRSIALSVSADHLVGRYDLQVCALPPTLLLVFSVNHEQKRV